MKIVLLILILSSVSVLVTLTVQQRNEQIRDREIKAALMAAQLEANRHDLESLPTDNFRYGRKWSDQ